VIMNINVHLNSSLNYQLVYGSVAINSAITMETESINSWFFFRK